VLAAGKSTRLGEFAQGLPKPLIRIAGQPLIVWNLVWIAEAGVRSAWINVHHRGELIEDVLGHGEEWGLELRYSHEPELLGTAGAWKNLAAHWQDTSLVIYGDNLMRFDLRAFLEVHRGSAAAVTMAVFHPARHANTGTAGGRAVLDDSGRVIDFVEGREHADAGFINAGAYLIEPHIASRIGDGFQDFGRDVLPALSHSREFMAYELESGAFCLGVDTPERFVRAEHLIQTGQVKP
jgi:mannose-1-phosphate guanylyltransferase